MFRPMRRFKQELSKSDCEAILNSGKDGVLALSGDDGYPYAVPLNYVYYNGCIYFHCALSGHKIDAIKNSDKASFCVIDKRDIIQEKYTTFFRSVILFGRICEVTDENEKIECTKAIAEKYSPDFKDGISREIEKSEKHLNALRLDIEHMSGKQAIELVK